MNHSPPLIVIANDNRMYLELLMDLLREADYQVIIADSGPSAHQLIAKKRADLAILDMSIATPDSVIITLTMLRADPTTKDVPVILCAVHTDIIRDNIEHFESMGCRVVFKPFPLAALLTAIHAALSTPDETSE